MWDLIVSVPDHCLSFYLVFTDHLTRRLNATLSSRRILRFSNFATHPTRNILFP